MDENNLSVPYIVHEGDMTRLERTNRRLQDVDTGNGDATVIGIGGIYGEGETEG